MLVLNPMAHFNQAGAQGVCAEAIELVVRVATRHLGRTAPLPQEAIHRKEGRCYRPEDLAQPEDAAALIVNGGGLFQRAQVPATTLRTTFRAELVGSADSRTSMGSPSW